MLNHIKNLYKGRLGRLDYLFVNLLSIPVIIIPIIMFTLWYISGEVETDFPETTLVFFGTLGTILLPISIYFVILHIGAIVRRSHDTNTSGLLGVIIYILGNIFFLPHLFLLLIKDPNKENRYGVVNGGNFFRRVLNLK